MSQKRKQKECAAGGIGLETRRIHGRGRCTAFARSLCFVMRNAAITFVVVSLLKRISIKDEASSTREIIIPASACADCVFGMFLFFFPFCEMNRLLNRTQTKDATSNETWGPSGTMMNELAQMTNHLEDFTEVRAGL